MTEAKYRVGVIGGGRKGTQHARAYALNPLSEVVAIADTDTENLELFQERFDLKTGYTDYKEMLRKESIDIAAPILPVSVNPEVVIGCARGGVKAIFCEKPASVSLAEADQMVEECGSRGIAFAAGDAYRNFHQLWEARRVIESGDIGEVQSINLYQATNEISGGGCQGLSVMRMFAWDADVAWVTGWVRDDPFSDEDQGMGGYVRFANGIECFIHFKEAAKKGIEVVCSKGVFWSDWSTFRLWKLDGSELKEEEGLFEDAKPWGPGLDDEGWVSMSTRQADSIQSINDALEKGIEPRCSGDNMRKVLEIAIALRESHRNNHAPIRLPLEDRSLKIIPAKSRLLYKKEVYGKEWYATQMHQKQG